MSDKNNKNQKSSRHLLVVTSVGNGFEYRIEYSNILIFGSFK